MTLDYLEWVTVLKALEYTDKENRQIDLSEIIGKVRKIAEEKQKSALA